MGEMPKYNLRIRLDPENVIARRGSREGRYPVKVSIMTINGVRVGLPLEVDAFDEDPFVTTKVKEGYYRVFGIPDGEPQNEASIPDFYVGKDTTKTLQLK
ncbi:MAG: hypothetical protein HYW26_05280 [Candidatus Aenigmarchaeota archaeon]|nr:hypothetical protein [Candidatus Aenigmarchaeota archaeon]